MSIELNGVMETLLITLYIRAKDAMSIVNLCPVLKQKGLINFTDTLKCLLPGAKKLLTPIMYIMNDRLGIYFYEKGHNE